MYTETYKGSDIELHMISKTKWSWVIYPGGEGEPPVYPAHSRGYESEQRAGDAAREKVDRMQKAPLPSIQAYAPAQDRFSERTATYRAEVDEGALFEHDVEGE